MDQIEVMLRFGNALLKSPASVELNPDILLQKEKHLRKRSDRKDEYSPSSKREFFGYFMSLMRTNSSENGDDMPMINPNPYRHLALIAEAYLFHMNITELIDPKLKGAKRPTPVVSLEGLFINTNNV
jgi:hypothetical protein